MNAKGRKELIESLKAAIDKWLVEQTPNDSDATDIGYVSDKTTHFMAIAAINVVECNSELQRFVLREGLLRP